MGRGASTSRVMRVTASALFASSVQARVVPCLFLVTTSVFVAAWVAPGEYVRLLPSLPLDEMGWQWWRLVSANFTHFRLWHIAGNMLVLLLFGPPVEKMLGRSLFLGLYLVSGVVALLAVSFRGSACVGASGALFAVIGALFVLGWSRRKQSEAMLGFAALALLGGIFFMASGPILHAVFGLLIANDAHVAGLVMGLLLGALLERRNLGKTRLR